MYSYHLHFHPVENAALFLDYTLLGELALSGVTILIVGKSSAIEHFNMN
jgi:hypothetical protein